jgi:NADH-ubiquinone oxidoreductase chain 3
MTSTTFFIIFIPILAILLLAINLILAPHNPYLEKDSVFECGFHSFLGQNRTQFSISFFIFGLLFLLFDLEILLVYPYSVSSYTNDTYGLVIMMVFFVLLTLGFIFELGKNALTIDSRQTSYNNGDISTAHAYISGSPGLDNSSLSDTTEPGPKEVLIYIPLKYKEGFILVPIYIRDAEDFEFDLTKKNHSI